MENIFSTKERIRILEAVIYMKDIISVNSLADKLKLSKGLVSKYLDILTKDGILKRVSGKFIMIDSAHGKGIKILLNIKRIPIMLFKKYKFIKSAGIYGSCARGENNEESDVDLWVRVEEAEDQRLAEFSSALKKKVEQLKVLFLTDKKIEKLKKEDELFYHSLALGSIIIYGGNNGVQL